MVASSEQGGGFALRSRRLVLRPWREEDRRAFRAMNADEKVMTYFPRPMSSVESDALMDAFNDEFTRHRYCPFALELSSTGEFIGFTGLHQVPAGLSFAPAVEVGWRLVAAHWGKGYATEAAIAALSYGFFELSIDSIVSFTAKVNEPSQRVMMRSGLTRVSDGDFEHPLVETGHRLRPHVLYRAHETSWHPLKVVITGPDDPKRCSFTTR